MNYPCGCVCTSILCMYLSSSSVAEKAGLSNLGQLDENPQA
jgi:hypothetical protein